MEVDTLAMVRAWDDGRGWGVLDSDATPGGCWAHFSVIDVEGYRSLAPGQQVRLTAESARQDGYLWRAVHVRLTDETSAATDETASDAGYGSHLSLTVDDEP